jgi:hypothetical protein
VTVHLLAFRPEAQGRCYGFNVANRREAATEVSIMDILNPTIQAERASRSAQATAYRLAARALRLALLRGESPERSKP